MNCATDSISCQSIRAHSYLSTSSRSTASVSIEFPISRRRSPFGPIVDPRILIEVRTVGGFRGYSFLLDTGADVSVVPRRMAQQLGFDWGSLPDAGVTGIGRDTVPAKVGRLLLRI